MSNPSAGKLTPKKAREILGVDVGADKAAINEAYRELAKGHHPDHTGRTDEMTRVNKARDLLVDQLDSSGGSAGQGAPSEEKEHDRTEQTNRERQRRRQERRERQERDQKQQHRRERQRKRQQRRERRWKRKERRDQEERRSRDYTNRDQGHSGERVDADEQAHNHGKNPSSQELWLPQFLTAVYRALGIAPVIRDLLRLTGLDTAIGLTRKNGSLAYFPVAWGIAIRRRFWPAVTLVLHTGRSMGVAFVRHPIRSLMWGFLSMVPFLLFIYTLTWYTDAGLRLFWAVVLGVILLAWLRILVVEIPELGYYSGMTTLCIWIWDTLTQWTGEDYSLMTELNGIVILSTYAMISFVYLQRQNTRPET